MKRMFFIMGFVLGISFLFILSYSPSYFNGVIWDRDIVSASGILPPDPVWLTSVVQIPDRNSVNAGVNVSIYVNLTENTGFPDAYSIKYVKVNHTRDNWTTSFSLTLTLIHFDGSDWTYKGDIGGAFNTPLSFVQYNIRCLVESYPPSHPPLIIDHYINSGDYNYTVGVGAPPTQDLATLLVIQRLLAGEECDLLLLIIACIVVGVVISSIVYYFVDKSREGLAEKLKF